MVWTDERLGGDVTISDGLARVVRLRTGYNPTGPVEQPVSRCRVAAMFGVCPKTVDRWVARDGMPQDTPDVRGCWIMVGSQRRYYPARVREWLACRN